MYSAQGEEVGAHIGAGDDGKLGLCDGESFIELVHRRRTRLRTLRRRRRRLRGRRPNTAEQSEPGELSPSSATSFQPIHMSQSSMSSPYGLQTLSATGLSASRQVLLSHMSNCCAKQSRSAVDLTTLPRPLLHTVSRARNMMYLSSIPKWKHVSAIALERIRLHTRCRHLLPFRAPMLRLLRRPFDRSTPTECPLRTGCHEISRPLELRLQCK